ncbi:MAG: sugar phosphate isomerase/epimerase [Clostridiales bacterium]|nr:sugar phosphate isomerase/epimerase [Clostridiales bacterium]
MSKYQFALELYSVRNELKSDLRGTLKAVAAMGYEGVEFAGGFAHSAQETADALREAGLICCGWHTPWSAVSDAQFEATVAYNKAVGNTRIMIPGLPGELTGSLAGWQQAASQFNALSARLRERGMTIGYHNHHSEFAPIDGVVPYYYFFDRTDPSVTVQIDNGNAMSGGADVMEIMNRYPGRFDLVHLKPYSRRDGFATMIGEDDVPWAEFMAFCRTRGNTAWYIVEYECETLYTPLDGVDRCLKALRRMESDGVI